MIITIASQKGGVGKSTLTCNLAAAMVQKAHKVIVVDADSQWSTSFFCSERTENRPDLPHIPCVQKQGYINAILEDLNEAYSYVLVDCAGRDSPEMRSAMAVSDCLITPIKASKVDLITLSHLARVIRQCTEKANPKLLAYCVLNMAPTNKKTADIENAIKSLQEYPEMTLYKTILYYRRIYMDCMGDGIGVIESDSKSTSDKLAREEILNLVTEVLHGV